MNKTKSKCLIKIISLIKRLVIKIFRNSFTYNGKFAFRKRITLEYWTDKVNLGDLLSPIVVNYVLGLKKLNLLSRTKKKTHLMAIGSILGMGVFDSVIWGSGCHTYSSVAAIFIKKNKHSFDIRAVRGPISRQILLQAGYSCPSIYGDPGILMPLVYQPKNIIKKYDISIIPHYLYKDIDYGLHKIDIQTVDYKKFIDEVCSSKKIISSSLHGLILAESYGIPCVLLLSGMENSLLKYYDYYLSTERYSFSIAMSVEEALTLEPMQIPVKKIEKMRTELINSFPYDIWE